MGCYNASPLSFKPRLTSYPSLLCFKQCEEHAKYFRSHLITDLKGFIHPYCDKNMGTIYQSAQKKNNTYHLRTSRGHAIAANEDHPAMNHFLKVLSSVDIDL